MPYRPGRLAAHYGIRRRPKGKRRRNGGMKKRGRKRGRKQTWGGTLKFATRYPGGNRVTQIPMPQAFFTKHPFYSTGTSNPMDDFDLKDLSPSWLFDVDGNGGDAGFAANMNAFYKFYVVLGYSYRITMSSCSNDTTAVFLVVPWPTSEAPATLAASEYRAGAKTAVLGVEQGGNAQRTLSGYVNTSALFGTKLTEEEEFWGQDTNKPARETHLYVVMQSMNDDQDWCYAFQIHLTLYVKWFNRATSGQPALTLDATKAMHIESLKKRLLMLGGVEEEKVEMAVEPSGIRVD